MLGYIYNVIKRAEICRGEEEREEVAVAVLALTVLHAKGAKVVAKVAVIHAAGRLVIHVVPSRLEEDRDLVLDVEKSSNNAR